MGIACDAGATHSSEPMAFLPGIQAISWYTAVSVPDQSPYGACQAAAGRAGGLGDGNWPDARLQQSERVRHSVSEGHRAYPYRLSPKLASGPAMTPQCPVGRNISGSPIRGTTVALVGDGGYITNIIHLEAVGPICVGFATARKRWPPTPRGRRKSRRLEQLERRNPTGHGIIFLGTMGRSIATSPLMASDAASPVAAKVVSVMSCVESPS